MGVALGSITEDFMCITLTTCIIQLISVGLLKLKYLVESEPFCIPGYSLKYRHSNIIRGQLLMLRCQDLPHW